MNIDLRTLTIIISLTNVLQVIALFVQYRLDNTHRGLGWWTLGNLAVSLGFAANYLRDTPALGPIAIVANNVLFVSGMALFYVGVLRFFDRRERRGWLSAFCAVFTLLIIYFTYLQDDLAVRRAAISVAVAALSGLIARVLFIHQTRSVTASAYFLAGVFLANGAFFAVRALVTITGAEAMGAFTASLTQTETYLVIFTTSLLWTFGFILLVNQRLNAESREAKDNLELIFNTNPDAVLITRLTDGYFVGINEGFTALTGYTRAEALGQSTLQINIWQNPADRQQMVTALTETGVCDNLEAVFQRKDGRQLIGMLSARLLTLQGAPHIISVTRDITERQRVAEALRQSEARYRLLFEQANDAIFIENDVDDILDVNRRACDLLGYTRAEMLALKLTDIQAPEVRGPIGQTSQAELAQHANTPFETIDLRRDGTRVPVEVTVSRLVERDRRLALSIVRDISQRKQAEEALQASRRQLADIVTFLPDATLAIDRQGRIILWNKAIEDMTGIPAATMIGQGGYAYTIPFYGEARPQLMDLVFADQAEVAARYPGITRTGDTLMAEVFCNALYHQRGAWVTAKAAPLHDQSGNIIGAIEIIRDITARKQAEDALRESELKYRSLIENSSDVVFCVNAQGEYQFTNRVFASTFGKTPDDFIGKTWWDVYPQEEADYRQATSQRMFETGVTQSIEVTVPLPDKTLYFIAKANPIKDDTGKVILNLTTATDITERKQAEEALRELNAELQTRNEELDAFAHTVAHDLKNPLGVMLGYAELLADDFGAMSADATQKALTAIHRNGRKANDIIGSLLLLASVRKQDVQAEPLDMAHIVDEVLLRLADSIQTSEADLHVLDRLSWPIALGYAPWIEEIWANYVSNAFKYGGPQPRIDLGAARQPDGSIRFSVRDYGPGLTPEQQARLFAPFERLGQVSVKGHGLGLSVVRRIADKLGGRAGVDSQPGYGSAFYFTLPAAPPDL